MDKLSILVNYIEMARVTGVPIDFLLKRGQQIKVMSMLLRKCAKHGYIIPVLPKTNTDATYEGATVIDPIKAYYQEPIATLDFASLYPSIMQVRTGCGSYTRYSHRTTALTVVHTLYLHSFIIVTPACSCSRDCGRALPPLPTVQGYNLCYSTLVPKDKVKDMDPATYMTSPSGDTFVNSTHKKGLLPLILEEILAARKQAKKDMKNAKDPMEKAVQNGRQLALKVSANSVYGFTGATVGQLPCLAIASSTTSYGRDLLFKTKELVEAHYTVANGYSADAVVVYGDTDSVMINFGVKTVAESMPLAEDAAARATKIFPRPIALEFEKVYFPYLLMNKKRYAGLLWTNPDHYDKLDCKGLETVRRDNCLLVRKVISTVLRMIIIEQDVAGSIEYVKTAISDMLQNKMDISYLVITKQLGKMVGDEDYVAKQAHVELAHRMFKRDPGSAPQVGDRVPYVIVQSAKGLPMFEKSEDPVFALENSIPLDYAYYLENQLSAPLKRIYEPIIDNPDSLLKGAHTLVVHKATPNARAGGIMMFAVKKERCLACKTPMASGGGSALCHHCKPREGAIYMEKLRDVSVAEATYSELWTQCQRCQGSLHQDVICTNKDCTIFYKRKKVQKDLQEAQGALDRFSLAW
jgi:DNA polymerase delta subunit 1